MMAGASSPGGASVPYPHRPLSAPRPDEIADRPSLWLYVGGLLVTMSGLYATSLGQDDALTSAMTYLVAFAGYAGNYAVRRYQIPFDRFRLPVLVLAAVALLVWITAGDIGNPIDSSRSLLHDKSHSMQAVCLWIALIHTFATATDASVLFACVPCISLIALVSTTNPDDQIQYAFLVFVGAATFLMIHENYLRTRQSVRLRRALTKASGLPFAQLQLAICCVAATFLLANLVATPMRAIGQSLFLSGSLPQNTSKPQQQPPSLYSAVGNETQTIYIGTGPVTESDNPVMHVDSQTPSYWRGVTYDFYTGRSFENHLRSGRRLSPIDEQSALESLRKPTTVDGLGDRSQWTVYPVPTSGTEIDPKAAHDPRLLTQTYTMLTPSLAQCYSAGQAISVTVPKDQILSTNAAGAILSGAPFPANARYRVESMAPSQNEAVLKASPGAPEDYPAPIFRTYLQVAAQGAPSNPALSALVSRITRGKKTPWERVDAIERYVASTCKYNLQAAAIPAREDVVHYFLEVSHEGYCDSFAAATTLLCRYAGVPARMAVGYRTGDPDKQGGYIVRQKHKHAWTEAFIPQVGWVTLDATNDAEDISDRSQKNRRGQAAFLTWVSSHGWLPPLLLTTVFGVSIYLVWAELLPRLVKRNRSPLKGRSRPESNIAVLQTYDQACQTLAKAGLRRSRYQTAQEYLGAVKLILGVQAPAAAEALSELTALHDRFNYSNAEATRNDMNRAESSLRTLASALKSVPRKKLVPASQPA